MILLIESLTHFDVLRPSLNPVRLSGMPLSRLATNEPVVRLQRQSLVFLNVAICSLVNSLAAIHVITLGFNSLPEDSKRYQSMLIRK